MQPFSSPAGPDKSGVGGGQAYWVRSRGLIGARVAQTSSRANDPANDLNDEGDIGELP